MNHAELERYPSGHPGLAIECLRETIDAIRVEAVEGLNRLRRGGLEIGGVLLGHRLPGCIRVLEHKALSRSYELGPSFTLSDAEKQELSRLVTSAYQAADGSSLETVGWYHSQTRGSLELSDRDAEIFNTYFSGSVAIGLLVKPYQLEPTRAVFYLNSPYGPLVTDASGREFVLAPRRIKRTSGSRSPSPADLVSNGPADLVSTSPADLLSNGSAEVPVSSGPSVPEIDVATAPADPVPAEIPALPVSQQVSPLVYGPTRRFRTPAVLAALIIVSIAAWLFSVRAMRDRAGTTSTTKLADMPAARDAPAARDPGKLTVTRSGGMARIGWNLSPAAARDGQTAELEIVEKGTGPRILKLNRSDIERGEMLYAENASITRVDFRVLGRESTLVAQSTVQLVDDQAAAPPTLGSGLVRNAIDKTIAAAPGSAESSISAIPKRPAESPKLDISTGESERMKSDLRSIPTGTATSQQPISALAKRDPISSQSAREPISTQSVREPVSSQNAREPIGSQNAIDLPPPATAVNSFASVPVLPIQPLPSPPPPRAQAAAPARREIEIDAAEHRAGRGIWTGQLARGDLLMFDAGRPSDGSLTGSLPSRAMRIQVSPAELVKGGIVVYTAAGTQRTEPPGPQTGWNLLVYKPDAARVRQLSVVESPGPANNWSRLVLRNEDRKLHVVVIDWVAAP